MPEGLKGIQEVTRAYKGLQGATRSYKGLQEINGG